jgi:hypothetical protein
VPLHRAQNKDFLLNQYLLPGLLCLRCGIFYAIKDGMYELEGSF